MVSNTIRELIIGNLGAEATQETIKAAFIPFGDIKSVDLPVDQHTKQLKGFAHVEFEEVEDCEHAIFNMNESEFFGRVIQVSYAKPIKKESTKPVWQTEDYLMSVAQPTPERAGLVKVRSLQLRSLDALTIIN